MVGRAILAGRSGWSLEVASSLVREKKVEAGGSGAVWWLGSITEGREVPSCDGR